MAARHPPSALLQFVDDEMLRAPLLFDQLIEGAVDHARKAMPALTPSLRAALAEVLQALQAEHARLAEYFMRSLREQVDDHLARQAPKSAARSAKPQSLALVDEDEVAMDVELSHTIEAIKSSAEYELRELQTFTSALVGDMDVARDHNPFRAETYARAVWAAAQVLPLSRGHQVLFLRHASAPLAQLLRRSYAAACSRLESNGVEPAAYRTLILPAGSRRGGRSGETTFTPDLYRMRESMPMAMTEQPLAGAPLGLQDNFGAEPADRPPEPWRAIADATTNRFERQAIELVSRLFEAMLADERLPADVALVISRLHGPALRLTLHDSGLLEHDKHPLWRFINELVFEAEMTPDPADPDRAQLLKVAQGAVSQLNSQAEQNTGLYRWALDKLETFLQKRLARRLAAASSQIGALQKLEDRLTNGQGPPSTLHGTLDVPQLDTVPAELLDDVVPAATAGAGHEAWLDALAAGDWVRMFLQGRWVQARLLWPGEHREIWLFGDGASDSTWAIRRSALLLMRGAQLIKTLRRRSIVGSAANRVHEQVAASAAS